VWTGGGGRRFFVVLRIPTSLAGAVGDVGNAELYPAFSKDCGKARASQRGFPWSVSFHSPVCHSWPVLGGGVSSGSVADVGVALSL
jgi:hypothetical protein